MIAQKRAVQDALDMVCAKPKRKERIQSRKRRRRIGEERVAIERCGAAGFNSGQSRRNSPICMCQTSAAISRSVIWKISCDAHGSG